MHHGLLTTSAGYRPKRANFLVVGLAVTGLLAQQAYGAGTTTIEPFKAVSPPQTNAGASAPEPSSANGALSELRRLSGLSWEQIARMLDVSRRALHFWASGKPIARSNEEHLERVLAFVRTIDRGSAAATRTALLQALDGQHNAVDLLAAREYNRAASATTRLTPDARAAKAPMPPETLVSALQDRVHQDLGPSRPARSVKVDRRK